MFISYRCLTIVSLCVTGGGLGGCATTTAIPLAAIHGKAPIRILAMESPMTIGRGRLQTVLAPDVKRKLSVSEEPISQGMKHAQQHALAAMESSLTNQSGLIIVTPPADEEQFFNVIQGHDLETAISQEEADRIQMATGADALLRFAITDYGLTPKSWRKVYITFEVTTTLAIAGIIAYSGSTVAKAAAGAYLVQETVEETAETYAGFWVLDVVCRPVRIEAELIRLNPVTTIWKTSHSGLSDVRLSRLIRKVEPDERDRQLDQATDHAAKDIVSALSDALNNTGPEPDRHEYP